MIDSGRKPLGSHRRNQTSIKTQFMLQAPQADERINCQIEISLKQIKVDQELAEGKAGPYSAQILRGPLKSEQKRILLSTEVSKIPVDLNFQLET